MSRPTRRSRWGTWLRRWDSQQQRYLPHREERFTAMLDVLEVGLPTKFRVLDIGCGPGSLSLRILSRFSRARCVAVDFDPVLLEIGQHALPDFRGRLKWVEADLRRSDWTSKLPRGGYDAAVSTTALHWLMPPELRRTYRQIHSVLRPHGLFLNGDHLPYSQSHARLNRLAREAEVRWLSRTRRQPTAESWNTWWFRLEREPDLAPLFAERERRYGRRPGRRRSWGHQGQSTPLDEHLRLLRAAGFHEAGVVWSEFANRVLLAIA